MLKNYIKVAWRSIIRNKGYSLISTVGLAVGVACCILVGLYVYHEISYESHHRNAEEIYRVGRVLEFGETLTHAPTSPYLLGSSAVEQLPEVRNAVRLTQRNNPLISTGKLSAYEEGFYFAEPSLFEIFTLPFVEGDPATALSSPGSIVISRQMAEKYFPDGEAMGEAVRVNGEDPLTVTGITINPPSSTNLPFHFLASSDPVQKTWAPITSNTTFLLLNEAADTESLEQSLMDLASANSDQSIAQGYFLERLDHIHLWSPAGPTGDIRYLYIFSAVAFFLLLIACINYTNLSLAQLLSRNREVGMRKVLGARQSQLSIQYLVESMVLCLFVFMIALILVELAYPFIDTMPGIDLAAYSMLDYRLWAALIPLAAIISLLSVAWITLILSRKNPASIFRNRRGREGGSMMFRRGLITFQFVISITLICCTLVIQRQLEYVQESRLGFDEERVMVLDLEDEASQTGYQVLKNELESVAGVQSVSASNGVPVSGNFHNLLLGEDSPLPEIHVGIVDEDFVGVMGFTVSAGDISQLEEGDLILNSEAAAALNNQEIGQSLVLREGLSGEFAAVVEDFHFQSMHAEIQPLALQVGAGWFSNMSIRLQPGSVNRTIARIENVWQEFAPGQPMIFSFLDDRVDAVYQADRQFARIFWSFSFITIVISCMGLFALSSLAAERRTKEVGIRKIMGATTGNIVALLSADFVRLVAAGFVIAVPITLYAMNHWLANFAYRIEPGPGIFLLAGGAALLIAMATVSWQSIRAALANPVDSLRSE